MNPRDLHEKLRFKGTDNKAMILKLYAQKNSLISSVVCAARDSCDSTTHPGDRPAAIVKAGPIIGFPHNIGNDQKTSLFLLESDAIIGGFILINCDGVTCSHHLFQFSYLYR
jgi:hypothetical protein